MPTYLADLSINDPQDTEVVSQGAQRIRTLTEAAKTTIDVEHAQTGEHQFPVIQPGSPINGQIWFDLVNMILRRYNGTDHTQLNAVNLQFGVGAASTGGTTTYVNMATVAVTTFAGSRVLLFTQFGAATNSQIDARFVRGVTAVSARVGQYAATALTTAIPMIFVDIDVPTAGTYTYAMQAKVSGAGTALIINPLILALVV